MRELQTRARWKRRMYSIPALIVLCIVTFALMRGAYALMVKERQSARDAELLRQKVSDLSAREVVLQAEIASLNTDAGIEEEIKSRYNVARVGEQVAVIVDRPGATTTEPEAKPWYKRLWDAILSR
jgi:cell division protein FtsB